MLTASQPFTSALVMSNSKDFKYEWIWEKNQGSNFQTLKYMPMKQHENVLVFRFGDAVYNPIMIARSDSSLKRDPADKCRNKRTYSRDNSVYGAINEHFTITTGTDRNPKTVLQFKVRDGLLNTVHPTQKPVALFEYMIKTYTNAGMTVLDNTMGSGTTGVAAMNLDRHFIGIEKDEKYFQIACKRIEQAQQQLKLAL